MASWTIASLHKSAARVRKWRKTGYSHSGSRKLTLTIPYPDKRAVLVGIQSKGITVHSTHQVYLYFEGVDVIPADDADHSPTHFKVRYRNADWWVSRVDITKTPVRVRCSCPDHYFTYAWWNYQRGCHFGPKPRPYVRKTEHLPEVNPGHHPGFCKHVLNAVQWIQQARWTSLHTPDRAFRAMGRHVLKGRRQETAKNRAGARPPKRFVDNDKDP